MADEQIRVALGLMRHALRLLDESELEGWTTPRLQHAIDTLLEVCPELCECDLEPELACLIAGIPLSEQAA